MDFRIERVAVGVRFKMSRFGAIQCPSLADRVGIVLELSPSNTGVTVLFDGDRRPTCLHRDYISPASERQASDP